MKQKGGQIKMQIVIDIPEEVKHNVNAYGLSLCPRDKEQLINAIKNGTPLPKGHGRLIDADDVKSYFSDREGDDFTAFHFYDAVESAPTVIDADKEQEDNGFFDEIMDDSEDGEVYEKIKEIIAKVKEQKCHTCKHYLQGEYDGSCGSYICKNNSGWEDKEQEEWIVAY